MDRLMLRFGTLRSSITVNDEQLKILADYVIANHFPHLVDGSNKYARSSPRLSSAPQS